MIHDTKFTITVGQGIKPNTALSFRCPLKAAPRATSDVKDALPGVELTCQPELDRKKPFIVVVSKRSPGILMGLTPEFELGVTLGDELMEHMPADSCPYSLKLGHGKRLSALAGMSSDIAIAALKDGIVFSASELRGNTTRAGISTLCDRNVRPGYAG